MSSLAWLTRAFAAIVLLSLAPDLPVRGQSVSFDKQMGERASRAVELQIGLYENPALEKYVSELGARLVAGLGSQPFAYQFAIADMREPNAFALPGGYVYASRGVLAVANSEDELANVLAHEIIHVHRRHSVKSMRRALLPALLTLPGEMVGMVNEKVGAAINAPIRAGAGLALANYSRKQESDSDKRGVALAAWAGYDPNELKSCLTRLSETVELITGEKERFSYFDSHPFTPNRVKRLDKEIAKLTPTPTSAQPASREEYLRRLDGLIIGQNPAQGLVEENVFLHPDLGFRIELPEGWTPFNTPVAFGAIAPDSEGQLILGLEEKHADPKAAASALLAEIETKHQITPVEADGVDVNGQPGYFALFTEESKKRTISIYMLWLRVNENLFRIFGTGKEDYRALMRDSVFTLRRLTPGERQSVTALRLRIAEAQDGETLEQFRDRTGDALPAQLTALLNDIEAGARLDPGRALKIGRDEPYRPQ